MDEIYNFGKTVIRKLLVLVFQKTKRNLTDKRGPLRVAAERTNDAVTSRERIYKSKTAPDGSLPNLTQLQPVKISNEKSSLLLTKKGHL